MKKTAGTLLLIASIISILVHFYYLLQSIFYLIDYNNGYNSVSQLIVAFLNLFLPIALLFVSIWMIKKEKVN